MASLPLEGGGELSEAPSFPIAAKHVYAHQNSFVLVRQHMVENCNYLEARSIVYIFT